MSNSKTEEAVIELIRSRGEVGRSKYGVSMDRRDLAPVKWLKHLQEELADGLQYAERLKGALELLQDAHALVSSLSHERGWSAADEWVAKYESQFDQFTK